MMSSLPVRIKKDVAQRPILFFGSSSSRNNSNNNMALRLLVVLLGALCIHPCLRVCAFQRTAYASYGGYVCRDKQGEGRDETAHCMLHTPIEFHSFYIRSHVVNLSFRLSDAGQ